jgi:hypothetical protein
VRAALVSLALLAPAACAATPEQVAARCERDAAAATSTSLSGEFAMGYAEGRGFVTDSDVAISAGVNLGGARDPRFVYEECVRSRTGQGPVRPYGVS